MGRFFLSIIIPTFNRSSILHECLMALAKQTVEMNSFEVIVGDDGSKDDTLNVLNDLVSKLPYRLKFFTQSNRGPNSIRNKAIEMAEAPVVVFFNDDTIALPDCLSHHIRLHNSYPDENIAVLGRVTIDPSIPYSPFAKLHLDYSYSQWEDRTYLDWKAFYTCNLSVKKNFLLKYGLFDEDIKYSDDVELGARLGFHGIKIIFCRNSIAYHKHFLTESEYLNIAVKEGKGLAVWFCKKNYMKRQLQELNFPLLMPPRIKARYFIGDMIFSNILRSFWIELARRFLTKNEKIALEIYKKCYQAIKRETIKKELIRLKCLR